MGNDGFNDGHNCTNYYVQPVSDQEDDGWLATTTAENPGDQYTPPTVHVTSPDGTTMEFSSNDAAWGAVPDTAVADRHGNPITYALTPSTQALTISDSAGRTVLTTSGFDSGTDTLTAADAQWKAAWGPSSFSQTIPITGVTCPNETAAWQGTGQVIQTLTTPEGVYQFAYDTTYGVLNKITFPNNGSVSYTWGLAAMPRPAPSRLRRTPTGPAIPAPESIPTW